MVVVVAVAAAFAATTGLATVAGWASIDGLCGWGLGGWADCGGRTVGGWWVVVAFVTAAEAVEGSAAVFAALDAGALAVVVFSTGAAEADDAGADISM
jgi:membrane-associated protease RseP (regulator of RpoE activity)